MQDFSHIDLVFRDTAARYEGGSQNVAGLSALGASIDFLAGFGMQAISRRVWEVIGPCMPATGGDRGRDP